MNGAILSSVASLRTLLVISVSLAAFTPLTATAGEECTAEGQNACNEVVWSDSEEATYISAKSEPAKVTGPTTIGPIDVPRAGGVMACRYIINTTGEGAFVPFQHSTEWEHFILSTAKKVTLRHCSRKTAIVMAPDCTLSGSSSTVSDILPYMQEGYTVTAQPTFICSGNKILERKTFVFKSGVSPDMAYTPPSLVDFSVSGWSFTASTETGGCGTADGKAYGTAPTTGLCTANTTASAATLDGETWKWTCKMAGNKLKIGAATPVATTATATCGASLAAACGTANGVATYTAPSNIPSTILCASGTASAVADVKGSPFTWTCTLGATTASCSAPRNTYGTCGSADGDAFSSFPTSNLCSEGDAINQTTDLAADPAFTWTCKGTTLASCSALLQPKCGTASGVAAESIPTTNLCEAGEESTVSGTGPWSWTCSAGGTNLSCSAPLKGNGACGAANGVAYTSAPTTGLCSVGTASAVTGTGPWNWTCVGTNGGTTASCSAIKKTSGSCGSADGVGVTTKPTTNLCSSGTATTVSGTGGWTWSCTGTNGGTTDSCSAPLKTNGACGSASGSAATVKPTSSLCSSGTASAVSGTGPWTWSCSGSNGGSNASCATISASPKCGTAANVQLTCPTNNTTIDVPKPTANLCSGGSASSVAYGTSGGGETSLGDRYYYAGQAYYYWTCTAGGTSLTCYTPSCSCAMCGWAHNNTASGASGTAPSTNLCLNGFVSSAPAAATSNPYVSGTMWWRWVCKINRTDGTSNDHACFAPRK